MVQQIAKKLKKLTLVTMIAVVGATSSTALMPQSASAWAGESVLRQGEYIVGNQNITSSNGVFSLWLQSDGNLVAYDNRNGRAYWHTGTRTGAILLFQGDGNLVLYDASWRPLWQTGTQNRGGAYAILQGDGNLVIYTASFRPLWGLFNGTIY